MAVLLEPVRLVVGTGAGRSVLGVQVCGAEKPGAGCGLARDVVTLVPATAPPTYCITYVVWHSSSTAAVLLL